MTKHNPSNFICSRDNWVNLKEMLILAVLLCIPQTLHAKDFKDWVGARETDLVKKLKRDITFAKAEGDDGTTYTISYKSGPAHVVEAYTVVDGIVVSVNRMAGYQTQEMAFKATDMMIRVYKNIGYVAHPDSNGSVIVTRYNLSIRLGYFQGDDGTWIAFQEAS